MMNNNVKWKKIDSCPSDGRDVIIIGGRYEKPTKSQADGDWWRSLHKSGKYRTPPTHYIELDDLFQLEKEGE